MAKRRFKNRIKEWGLALLFALIFALVIKTFVVQSFMVASKKMEKTILAGDLIMVNKIIFGARLPITLLSLPFVSSIYSSLITLPYHRTKYLQKIKNNDLIVFNYPLQTNTPIDKRNPMLKRCIALPGDTIVIDDKVIYVNNLLVNPVANLQFNYRLVTNGNLLNQEFLNKYNINEGGMVSEMGIYDFPISEDKIKLVKEDKYIRYVGELKDFAGVKSEFIFPTGKYYHFNKDNFGPLVVPFKGQEVQINIRTIELYKYIIEDYEKNKLQIVNSKIFINGVESKTYNINSNYYFVLDDNRDNAKDSRYWGFLPESHIIGKASFIWFSFDKQRGKIRWDRIFKYI